MKLISDNILARIRLRTKDNPILSKELEQDFNLIDTEIRDMIREFRRSGIPIASSKKGYFYARNYEELRATIEDLEGRCNSMKETLDKLKGIWKNEIMLFKC